MWFREPVTADEVTFEPDVFLLTKAKAQALKAGDSVPASGPESEPGPPAPHPSLDAEAETGPGPASHSVVPSAVQAGEPEASPGAAPSVQTKTIRLGGAVPPEMWNRLGTTVLPKLRSGSDIRVEVQFSVTVNSDVAESLTSDLCRILDDLELADDIQIHDA